MSTPTASGREAGTFAWDDNRDPQRYLRAGDVTDEAGAMAHVAGLSLPVSAVHEAHGQNTVAERLYAARSGDPAAGDAARGGA